MPKLLFRLLLLLRSPPLNPVLQNGSNWSRFFVNSLQICPTKETGVIPSKKQLEDHNIDAASKLVSELA
jgi:hypothetical protein